MKNNLIIGISSSIGKYFIKEFKKSSIFTYCNNPIKNSVRFDILTDKIDNIIDLRNFDNVLLLSAISDPNECIKNLTYSNELNIKKTTYLLEALFKKNIKIFFFSTEFIYDGKKGNYNENDKPNPILEYGKQKLFVENFIEKNYDNFVIYRIAKTYTNQKNEKSLIADWYEYFIAKKLNKISIASDQIFSPLYAQDLPKITKKLIEIDFKGKINIGGPEKLSRLDCLKIFLNSFNVKNVDIIEKSINNFKLPESRPLNTSLDIKLLKNNIDFELKKFSQICNECYEKFTTI